LAPADPKQQILSPRPFVFAALNSVRWDFPEGFSKKFLQGYARRDCAEGFRILR
jgi:hypothetical protein